MSGNPSQNPQLVWQVESSSDFLQVLGPGGTVLSWIDSNGVAQGNLRTSGNAVISVFGRTGAVVQNTGDYTFTQIGGSLAISQINATGTPGVGNFLRGDGSWQPAPGGVSSVFGRTGAVVATSGDYSFALISGTVAASQLPNPTASTLGGVQSIAVVTGNFLTGISTSGVPTQAQPTFSNIAGTILASQLPFPTASTLGGVQSFAAVAHNFVTQISTTGVVSAAQPAFTDISGTVAATQLPNPSASTLGGVESIAAVAHNFLTSISTSGVPAQAQPAFTDISGTVAAAQLPNPSASTLGGVESIAVVAHNFLTGISTSGVPSQAQPAFSDLSGSATAAQMPSATSSTLGAIELNTDLGGTATAPNVVATHLTAPLPVAQGGNGTATPSLQAGSNISITGSWPNQIIASTSSATALSSITAATAANSINNGNNTQTWNFALTTATKTAFIFTESAAATNGIGNQFIGQFGTVAGSTAVPLNVFSSLTGAQTLSTFSITPTWNTTGVVDAALLVNVTNTASGAGSKLADFQVGGTSQFSVDKGGNVAQLGTTSLGSSPPPCTPGTAGGACYAEGTAPTAGANYATIYASSTDHKLHANLNNGGDVIIQTSAHGVIFACSQGQQSLFTAPTANTVLSSCAAMAANTTQTGDIIEMFWNGEVGTATGGAHNGAFDIQIYIDSTNLGDIGAVQWAGGTQSSVGCGSATVTNATGTGIGGDQMRRSHYVVGSGGSSTAMVGWNDGSCITNSTSGNYGSSDNNVTFDPTISHTFAVKMHANAPTGSSVYSGTFSVIITRP